MAYRQSYVYSGAMLEIERVRCGDNGKVMHRQRRGILTSEAQQRANLKRAQLKLMRLMCVNFTRGDYHITLTMEHLHPAVTRKKEWAKFIRRLRALCRRRTGNELKYICVPEERAVRPHYHLVCSAFGLEISELQAMWPLGLVSLQPLDGCPDYGWLARYLTKQSEKDKSSKRWYQSKNLEEPVVQEKRLKRAALAHRPQVPKEYYVMSAYRAATADGYECEYIVAIRYDRKQQLPDDVLRRVSETWEQLMICGMEA